MSEDERIRSIGTINPCWFWRGDGSDEATLARLTCPVVMTSAQAKVFVGAEAELARLTTLRPASEWHEDHGEVLWWAIDDRDGLPHEAPYCGSLLEVEPPFPFDFDEETGAMHGPYEGYHLYWTPLPRVKPLGKEG